MRQVLSIDLGTSGCRSAVYGEDLKMRCVAKADYPLIVHSETEVEQSPDAWWAAVKTTIAELSKNNGLQHVRAISISSQGISLLPMDCNGIPLQNAISWLDTRAGEETEQLRKTFGVAALYIKTGLILSPLYSLPKLLWMRTHLSETMARTHKILLPMDYILYRLCGRMVTDHTMAAGTMVYSPQTRTWDTQLLAECGIASDKLPEILTAGTAAGVILPEVAQELGLPAQAVIAVGGQDQKCAAYGAGADSNTATASIGTCTCITKLVNPLTLDPSFGIPCFAYLKDGLWDMEGIIHTTGSALQWFRDKFAPHLTFAQLDALAQEVTGPAAIMFYPNLAGGGSPHWEQGNGMFANLTFSSDIGQCARAVMEGVGYGIRANLNVMDRTGNPTHTLHLFGGGANSPLWCQIIADILNRRVVCMQSSDTALAGAAKLAFESIGFVPPVSVDKGAAFEPDPACATRYDAAYAAYERLRMRMFEPDEIA